MRTCWLECFQLLDPIILYFDLIKDDMSKIRTSEASPCKTRELFDFICHVLCFLLTLASLIWLFRSVYGITFHANWNIIVSLLQILISDAYSSECRQSAVSVSNKLVGDESRKTKSSPEKTFTLIFRPSQNPLTVFAELTKSPECEYRQPALLSWSSWFTHRLHEYLL